MKRIWITALVLLFSLVSIIAAEDAKVLLAILARNKAHVLPSYFKPSLQYQDQLSSACENIILKWRFGQAHPKK